MSYWTHVNGSIRVDFSKVRNDEMSKLFKTAYSFPTREEREACNVPSSSEGSLNVSVWYNKDLRDTRGPVITIFGDLRDYGENGLDEIIDWINNVIHENEMVIRDGILTINEKIYRFNHETKKFSLVWREL